jgi:hypothetical protein
MNLIDFSTLNEEGREYVIFEYAVPVSTNLKNSCLHILYQLSDFFVEKIINLREEAMVKINCFDSSSEDLNDYLADISLP